MVPENIVINGHKIVGVGNTTDFEGYTNYLWSSGIYVIEIAFEYYGFLPEAYDRDMLPNNEALILKYLEKYPTGDSN